MQETVQQSIQAFLRNLELDSKTLTSTHTLLYKHLLTCKNDAQNLSAASAIPNHKFNILSQKLQKIPHLQQRIDSAAKRLLQAHKAITSLKKDIEQISKE